MRKANAWISLLIIILFVIHGIAGGYQMAGILPGGNQVLTVLAWIMVGLVCVHAVIGTILTVDTIRISKKNRKLPEGNLRVQDSQANQSDQSNQDYQANQSNQSDQSNQDNQSDQGGKGKNHQKEGNGPAAPENNSGVSEDNPSPKNEKGHFYGRENVMFILRRVSGFAILVFLVAHVIIFNGNHSGTDYRLNLFEGPQLALSIGLVISLAVHLLCNIKPMFIGLGVNQKKRRTDVIIILAVVLVFCAVMFAVYYYRWNIGWKWNIQLR